MTILFWVGLSWLAYVYVGYPILIWVLGSTRRVRRAKQKDDVVSVSVLIAARNEEKDIAWKIEQTLKWDYAFGQLQVLVGSDASDDRTDEIAGGIIDPRLIFTRMPRRIGKNSVLNVLARRATGDLLFFTDANSHIEAETVRNIVRHFADPRVGCVTGVEESVKNKDSDTIAGPAGAYLNYESLINRLESRIGSVLVCDGSIFCMRRNLFTELDPDLANDLELPIRIGAAGHWILFEPTARSQEHTTRSPWEEFARRKRICAQGALAAWKLRHSLRGVRGLQFLSRKCLRWISLLPVLMVVASSIAQRRNPWFAPLCGLEALFVGLAMVGVGMTVAGRQGPAIVCMPFYFLLATTAATLGTLESILGHRFGIWEVAQQSRGRRGQPTHPLTHGRNRRGNEVAGDHL